MKLRPAQPWRNWRPTLVRLSGEIGTREFLLLVLLVLAGAGVWAFLELADEVIEGETHAIDEAVLLGLRNPLDRSDPVGPGWLEELGRDVTALGGVGVLTLATLAAFGYLLLSGRRHAAVVMLLSIAGGILLSFLLKHGFDRPRPDLVPHASRVYTASFPSGHSMMSALVYLTLGALLARVHSGFRLKVYILGIASLLAILVGLSRIYLGVHWPSDVLAGWTAGATWALLCWLVTLWLQRKGQVERAGLPAP